MHFSRRRTDDHKEYRRMKMKEGQRFCRKVLKETKDIGILEASILQLVGPLHPNIVPLLYWHHDFEQPQYCSASVKSENHTINLVFPCYPSNLGKELTQNTTLCLKRAPKSGESLPLLRWPWCELIETFEALEAVHNTTHRPNIQDSKDIYVAVHFDLKPENILVDDDGALIIADFGQANLKMLSQKDYSSGSYVRGGPGAKQYRPPEAYSENNREVHGHKGYSRLYDIWSLGCIMLEVCEWAEGSNKAVERFRGDRGAEKPPDESQDIMAQFWRMEKRGSVLKPCVMKVLRKLLDSPDRGHRGLGALVQKMLSIKPADRPTAAACAQKLRDLTNEQREEAEKMRGKFYRWTSSGDRYVTQYLACSI